MPADVTGALIGLPARDTRPDEGRRNPATRDKIVVFPQPLGPTMDTNWPASKRKDMSRRTSKPVCPPNRMDTFSRTTDAGSLAMRQYPPAGSDIRREATNIHSRSATAPYKIKPSKVSAIRAENDNNESSDAEADKS